MPEMWSVRSFVMDRALHWVEVKATDTDLETLGFQMASGLF